MRCFRAAVAALLMITMIIPCMPSTAEAACTVEDNVPLLNHRIERCWREQIGGSWIVEAKAYRFDDGSFVCSRSYTYLGAPGDSRDLQSLRYVFDFNKNNYLDCLEGVPPPYEPGETCELPMRDPRPPIEE
jgi:hypothetical protein